MLATLRKVTPPAATAVDMEMATRHARIDSDADQDLFAFYVDVATDIAEKYLGRALITQTLSWSISQVSRTNTPFGSLATLAGMPMPYDTLLRQMYNGVIELPYSPVQSITSVKIGEWGQPEITLTEGTDYTSDLTIDPARLRLDPAYTWGTYNHLTCTYVAGYGATSAAIPRPIVNAVMMLALRLYENRGDDNGGGMSRAIECLLYPFRLVSYAG